MDWGSFCERAAKRASLAAVVVAIVGSIAAALLIDAHSALAQDAVDVNVVDVDAPASASSEPGSSAERSWLAWMIESLGPMYTTIFLGLSLALVALFVMNLLSARRAMIVPPGLVNRFERLLREKKFQEAYDLAKNDESFLGHVLAAGLARLTAGYPQAIEAMQEVGEEENMKLEHRLSYIALIGTISPMVGLLGTVDGMIASFAVIAGSTTQPKPSELAEGIATALFTTLVGLYLAIPAIAAYGILKNRIARLVLEVGIVGESLLENFQHVTPKKP
ncbi:MAG: MotA/TolQ/ExbB proton channel family protein [Pirellulales bacterium]|nr:MotA/TolQ/ExbB proton channel family protein [Pirellulales bacterium]